MTELATPIDAAHAADPATTLRVLWYWPFARPEEMDLAAAFAADGADLRVHVIDRDAAPAAGQYGEACVVRDLADVDRTARGMRWPFSRLGTYLSRMRQRDAEVGRLAPDVVHYHYVNRFTDGLRRPAATWILSVHDVEPHQPRLGRLERALLARVYRRPDGLVVHHPWLADRLVRDVGIDPARIAVVPHQVFPVAAPSPRPVATRPMVLCFGALRPNKGVPALIDVMTRPELAGLDLHIAGRGDPDHEHLIAEKADGIPNVTVELGHASTGRKDELFRQASVVVLPYRSFSSQSGVLHDAYGHGRPVVVTDVGALGPTVHADRTGLVVPIDQPSAMAEAIVSMAGPGGDEPARRALTMAAARSPESVAAALHTAYRRFSTPEPPPSA